MWEASFSNSTPQNWVYQFSNAKIPLPEHSQEEFYLVSSSYKVDESPRLFLSG